MNEEKINKINVKKKIAACISIVSNSSLILLKITAGLITGSISIISEALHSLADLMASCIAFFSVVKSSEPADDDHPFGHGKYEDLAGFIEALLIILTACYIFYIAIEKLIKFGMEYEFETNLGIIIMLISTIVNLIVSRYLFYMAKKSDSIALQTDAEHLSMDVYSSLAIFLGLFAVKLTGLYVLDPIFAIIVAGIIFKTGVNLTKQASNNLLDGTLPGSDREIIKNVLDEFKDHGLMGVKSIKTSKSGSKRVIQLTIFLPCKINLLDAHLICDKIEHALGESFTNSSVIIHAEPNCISGNREKCGMCKEDGQKIPHILKTE